VARDHIQTHIRALRPADGFHGSFERKKRRCNVLDKLSGECNPTDGSAVVKGAKADGLLLG
jgi:hypothetical protein